MSLPLSQMLSEIEKEFASLVAASAAAKSAPSAEELKEQQQPANGIFGSKVRVCRVMLMKCCWSAVLD